MKLPKLLLAFVDFAVRPIYVDDEPFPERLRKTAILVFTAMATIAVLAAPVVYSLPYLDPYGNGWNTFRVSFAVLNAHCLVQFVLFNYIYMRRTKSCPLWLADMAALGALGVMLEYTFISPHSDMRSVLIIISMMTAMLATPRLPLIILIQFFLYYYGYFRDYWRDEFTFLVFPFDQPFGTLFDRIFLLVGLSFFPVAMGVAGIHVVVRGYIQQNEEQRLARKMTLEVAKSLMVYDIDGVEETLKLNEGLVDAELLLSFGAIKENLKAFRPHIPQYLIEAAVERAEKSANSMDDMSNSDSEDDLSASAASTGSPKGTPRVWRRRRSNDSERSETNTSDTASSSGAMAASAHRLQAAAVVRNRGLTNTDAFFGQISSVFVDLGVKSIGSGFAQMSAAVDAINEAASATRTSIHTLQGDAIFASCNATSRSPSHAVHACSFAAKLRDVLASFSALKVTGSIVQTACHTVFAGTKQSHLLLVGEGLEHHAEQRALGKQLGTVVVNEAVAANAETWGMFAGFTTSAEGCVLYDLIDPHPQRGDGEWMYQLETTKNPWEAAGQAVRVLAATDTTVDSAAVLQQLKSKITPEMCDRPSMALLLRKLSH